MTRSQLNLIADYAGEVLLGMIYGVALGLAAAMLLYLSYWEYFRESMRENLTFAVFLCGPCLFTAGRMLRLVTFSGRAERIRHALRRIVQMIELGYGAAAVLLVILVLLMKLSIALTDSKPAGNIIQYEHQFR
jgi:hypothetical protein